jgi:hypothetical protein
MQGGKEEEAAITLLLVLKRAIWIYRGMKMFL